MLRSLLLPSCGFYCSLSFENRDLEATIHCTSAFTTTDVYVTSALPMSDLRRRAHTATTTLFSVVPSSTSSSLTVAATQSPLLQSLIAPRPSKPTQCHQPVATSFFQLSLSSTVAFAFSAVFSSTAPLTSTPLSLLSDSLST